MITVMEKFNKKIKTIRGIAEAGHAIAKDEISRGQFEQIIRELHVVGFQDWQAENRGKDDTSD